MSDRALAKVWALIPDNAPLALAVVGLLLYGVVWTAYSVFYRTFGLTPRDAGIAYPDMVQEAAVAVLVYALIVLVVLAGHYAALRALRVRLPRFYKAAVIAVGLVAAVLYPSADAYFSARHAKRGDGVQLGGGWFPLPLGLPLRAPRVSVRFTETSAASATAIGSNDCVVYLGATNETTVVWVLDSDKENGRVVQVPKRLTVIEGRSASCEA